MPRRTPRSGVLRALFARSGNKCAFPGCTSPLINERGEFIAQVCHIEAAELGGERYNPTQTDEERRSFANLILFCYRHHVETNDVARYSAESLRKMKQMHESLSGEKIFKINESLLYEITREMDDYWAHAERLHLEHTSSSDLAIEVNLNAGFTELAAKAHDLVDDILYLRDALVASDEDIGKLLGVLRDAQESGGKLALSDLPTEAMCYGMQNFEVLHLGFQNTTTRLRILLTPMELRHLEAHLKLNPTDLAAKDRLTQVKEQFAVMISTAGYVD